MKIKILLIIFLPLFGIIGHVNLVHAKSTHPVLEINDSTLMKSEGEFYLSYYLPVPYDTGKTPFLKLEKSHPKRINKKIRQKIKNYLKKRKRRKREIFVKNFSNQNNNIFLKNDKRISLN